MGELYSYLNDFIGCIGLKPDAPPNYNLKNKNYMTWIERLEQNGVVTIPAFQLEYFQAECDEYCLPIRIFPHDEKDEWVTIELICEN